MTQTITALLVEDDERLARLTADYLEQHEVQTTIAKDGDEGVTEALRRRFDVIVLDLMLPRKDGLAVCRQIRERSDVPIIMVTARTEESDRVLGLELGADDYLAKPFSPRELLARLRSMVRRDRGELGPKGSEIHVGRVRILAGSRRVLLDDNEIPLTTFEYELLLALAKRPGRVLSREQLLDLVHGSAEEAFDRSIDVHISRLRQKLGDDGRHAALVKTVRGIGYMLVAQESV